MTNFNEIRNFAHRSSLFSSSALVMADLAVRSVNCSSPELYCAMLLTIKALQEQHVCIRLNEYANQKLYSADGQDFLILPEYASWRAALKEPGLQAAVTVLEESDNEDIIPDSLLVVDRSGGCYLQKQWHFEHSIVQALTDRAQAIMPLPRLPEGYLHSLVKFFPDAQAHPAPDCQQLAVLSAQQHRLLVLSGGPGTGKTTVAAAILALALEQDSQLKIMLCAPTAKAAVRLEESLRSNLDKLQTTPAVLSQLQKLSSSTVHRLLEVRHDSRQFRHNRHNPLDCDLLLVDECSMLDQELMANLLEALPPAARLILLGDRCQLSSVEAGSVLADICDCARANTADAAFAEEFFRQTSWSLETISPEQIRQFPLSGCMVELTENHRFSRSAPLLGEIAGRIRNLQMTDNFNAVAQAIADLKGDEFEFINVNDRQLRQLLYRQFKQPRLESGECLLDLPALAAAGTAEARKQAFALLDSWRILSPSYQGARGIEQLNRMCMEILQSHDLHSPGIPLLIKKNDYQLELFNGDIGLTAYDEQQQLRVFFPGKNRSYHPGELPEHEVVFAMSVHKSQGSGFGEVVFVMPERSNALMTRELVYTAMTRSEKKLLCLGSVEVLSDALQQPSCRTSNLAGRLKRALLKK